MKKKLMAALAWVLLAGVAIVFPLSSAYAVSTFRYETETRIYNKEKITPGYLLLNSGSGGSNQTSHSNTTWLIDPLGRICHSWTGSGDTARLMEDGSLSTLGLLQTKEGTKRWEITTNPVQFGINFNGHHDGLRIFNKKLNQFTYLIAFNYTTTSDEQIAAGYIAQSSTAGSADGVYELDENKNVIWYWKFIDHTYQTLFPDYARYITPVAPGQPDFDKYLEKTRRGFDVWWQQDNAAPDSAAGITSDWQHVNALDYDEDQGRIVIDPKHFSQQVMIDHQGTFVPGDPEAGIALAKKTYFDNMGMTPAAYDAANPQNGDFMYRWGNPSSYDAGLAPGFNDAGDQQQFGPHCVGWVNTWEWNPYHVSGEPTQAGYVGAWASPTSANVMSGAGNMYVLDNGCYTPLGFATVIREYSPYHNSAGIDTCPNRVNRGSCPIIWEYEAGWQPLSNGVRKSKQEVWKYESHLANSFYSSHISGAQRLFGGAYMGCAGNRGQHIQIAPDGEVVWEYIRSGSRIATASTTSTFRSYWYTPQHPGIVALKQFYGGSFTPGNTPVGRTADELTYKVVGSGGAGCGASNACCRTTACPTCPDCEALGQCPGNDCCTTPTPVCPCGDCPSGQCPSDDCCPTPPNCACENCAASGKCPSGNCCTTLPKCACEDCSLTGKCPDDACCPAPPVCECADCAASGKCPADDCCPTPPACACEECDCTTCCNTLDECECDECGTCSSCCEQCPTCQVCPPCEGEGNPNWAGSCCPERACDTYNPDDNNGKPYCAQNCQPCTVCADEPGQTSEVVLGKEQCPTCATCPTGSAGTGTVTLPNGSTINVGTVKPAVSKAWGVGISTSTSGGGDSGSGSSGSSGSGY
jgi:hypothetical protein